MAGLGQYLFSLNIDREIDYIAAAQSKYDNIYKEITAYLYALSGVNKKLVYEISDDLQREKNSLQQSLLETPFEKPEMLPLTPVLSPSPAVTSSPVVAAKPVWVGQMSLIGGDKPNFVYGRSGLKASGGAPPANNFILFNDDKDSFSKPIAENGSKIGGGHNYSSLIWGSWSGGFKKYSTQSDARFTGSKQGTYDDLSGYFVYGQAMPVEARIGQAYFKGHLTGYDGHTRNHAVGGTVNSEFDSHFGELALGVNFGTGKLNGWLAFDSQNADIGVVNMINPYLYVENGVTGFRGGLEEMDGFSGGIAGRFYGSGGTELGGSYWAGGAGDFDGVEGQVGFGSGIFTAYEVAAMPDRPIEVSGQISYALQHFIRSRNILPDRIPVVGDTLNYRDDGQPVTAKFISTSRLAGYSHVSWGKWSGNVSSLPVNTGQWVAGVNTPRDVLSRRTGSATYKGEVKGDYISNNVREDAFGRIELGVNFKQSFLNGNMQWGHGGARTPTGGPGSPVVQLFSTISDDGQFFQNIDSNGLLYGFSGDFYGPNGSELGGTSYMFVEGGQYNGVFVAKEVSGVTGSPGVGDPSSIGGGGASGGNDSGVRP